MSKSVLRRRDFFYIIVTVFRIRCKKFKGFSANEISTVSVTRLAYLSGKINFRFCKSLFHAF